MSEPGHNTFSVSMTTELKSVSSLPVNLKLGMGTQQSREGFLGAAA